MLFSVIAFCQSAYKINVTSFKSDTYDISGSTEAKQDRFGRDCALIKIKTPNCNEAERSRFTVKCDAGALVVKPDKEGIGELRRYVTATCVRLFIQHPDFGETEYTLPMKLKAKSTYVMEIMVDKPVVGAAVLPVLMSNHVVISITPAEAAENAKITIDDNYIENNQVLLSLNEPHHLVIESKLYHTIDKIIYADKDKTLRLDEVMLPAYGFLNITSSPEQGATVFIDGEKVGTTPFKSDKLASGEHTVELVMPMYASVTKTCVVRDGNDGVIDIKMQPNFANVKLTAGDGVHILVDKEDKGVGSWNGRLMQGEHLIEARLDRHRSTYKNITVTAGKAEDITLEKPIPIYGQLNITSMPGDADIFIDNQKVGTTPMIMSKILIGSHELRLVKQGCAPFVKTITIEEGKMTEVSEKLDSGKTITITTGRSGDEIYVDGVSVGVSPLETAMGYGTHKVKAVRDGKKVEKEINVQINGGPTSLTLEFGKIIRITTDRKGDKVYIDGEYVGSTPYQTSLGFGNHKVKVVRGQSEQSKDIVVSLNGGDMNVLLEFGRLVKITTDRDGDDIFIDGKKAGVSPLSIDLSFGSHKIRARRGKKSDERRINVQKDGISSVDLYLRAETPSDWLFHGANFLLLNGALSTAPQTSFGLTVGQVKQLRGWYVSGMTNFNFSKADLTCDENGSIENPPLAYSFKERVTSRWSVTAGVMFRPCLTPLYLYAGAGYGKRTLLWKTDDGRLAEPPSGAYKGVSFDAGLMAHIKGFSVSAGVTTIGTGYMEFKVGIGFCLKRK